MKEKTTMKTEIMKTTEGRDLARQLQGHPKFKDLDGTCRAPFKLEDLEAQCRDDDENEVEWLLDLDSWLVGGYLLGLVRFQLADASLVQVFADANGHNVSAWLSHGVVKSASGPTLAAACASLLLAEWSER